MSITKITDWSCSTVRDSDPASTSYLAKQAHRSRNVICYSVYDIMFYAILEFMQSRDCITQSWDCITQSKNPKFVYQSRDCVRRPRNLENAQNNHAVLRLHGYIAQSKFMHTTPPCSDTDHKRLSSFRAHSPVPKLGSDANHECFSYYRSKRIVPSLAVNHT